MVNQLKREMIAYFCGDPKRIQHFIKVHSFATLIGQLEGLDEQQQLTLELAAVVHDIGIKAGEEKYGRNDGKIQEQEGPALAEKLLKKVGAKPELTERICYLVGHHHTYDKIDGLDYQILVEADFLVNLYEDGVKRSAVCAACENIFKTKTGKELCKRMYGVQ